MSSLFSHVRPWSLRTESSVRVIYRRFCAVMLKEPNSDCVILMLSLLDYVFVLWTMKIDIIEGTINMRLFLMLSFWICVYWLTFDLCRSVRKTTPSNTVRDSEALATPGSTNRPTSSTGTIVQTRSAGRRSIPITHQMEEFFAGAERQQVIIFTEKYFYCLLCLTFDQNHLL